MSSPAQAGPSVPQEKEKKGVGKMLSRVKTMMKRAEKRMSISGPSRESAPSSSAAAAVKTSEPIAAPAEQAPKKGRETPVGAIKVPRVQLHEERARKLGERFGLEIKPSEWHSTEGDALRVEKPIRMRVHRICHECKTTFGTAKECPKCKHPRCKDCQRYPPKRTEAEKIASRERRAQILKERAENAPIIPDWDTSEKDVELRKPGKHGGPDLVHRKPRQRIRRTCHECQALFTSGSKTCGKCGHARCTDCPRDPAKKDKYPYGYPGDEFGPNSIPHHKCHECKTKFPPNSADGTACANCSHEKCTDCPRLKPQRVEPEPDPLILRTIEQKLAQLRVST